jgi:hypothetical protein
MRAMKKEKKRNKILAFLIILLLLSSTTLYAQQQPQGGWQKFKGGLGKFVTGVRENWGRITVITLIYWLTRVIKSATDNFHSHLRDYILINPNPKHPEMLNVMGFFIKMALTFYVIAITFTGFYLIFVSGSPRGRARAKYTLGKLVLGMAFVSISPLLLQLLFQFSYSLSDTILDQGDIGIVTAEFNTALWRGYTGTLALIVPEIFGTLYGRWWTGRFVSPPSLKPGVSPPEISKLGRFLKEVKIADIGAIAMYPYFLIVVLLVLTFGLLAFRYLMLIIWTILFPLAIFFTSFDPTKNIGRIMIEQLLQWTFFQIFYAIILVAMSIGLMILPEGYTGFTYSMLLVAFHSIGVIFILFFYPWYLSSMLQRLFPP